MGWRRGIAAVAGALALVALSPAHASEAPARLWTDVNHRKVHRARAGMAKIAKRAMPAVAAISTHGGEEGEDSLGRKKGFGSGFLIHPDGYLVTSSHVVEGVKELVVTIPSPRGYPEEHAATLVGNDPHTDIALLKIAAPRKLPFLKLSSSSDVEVADWVVVVGNPFGLAQSVTVGVVSFKGRTDVVPNGRHGYFDFLQTDAPINPGNSGGPILALDGSVVAIANAVNVSGQGIGFGIPIEIAKAVVPRLLAEGKLRRGWLGLSVEDLTPALAASLGEESYSGARVSGVERGGPAERAGIAVGDVIVGLGGRAIDRAHQLSWRVTIEGSGRTLEIAFRRGGKRLQRLVTLASPPEVEPTPARLALGAAVSEVNKDASRLAGLSRPFGALVRSVDAGSALDRAGLTAGDVVLKVNRTEISAHEELVHALEDLGSGQLVRLYVRRGPLTLALSLRAP